VVRWLCAEAGHGAILGRSGRGIRCGSLGAATDGVGSRAGNRGLDGLRLQYNTGCHSVADCVGGQFDGLLLGGAATVWLGWVFGSGGGQLRRVLLCAFFVRRLVFICLSVLRLDDA